MAVEILDGSIEPAEPVRSKRGYLMFDKLRFRDRNGNERELKKVCCGGAVGEAVRKGGPGRYYLSSGGGQTGIHGVRLDDGTKAYAHYNNMEPIILVGIALGAIMLVLKLMGKDVMITPIVIAFALVGFYIFLRNIRLSGKKQYDADASRA